MPEASGINVMFPCGPDRYSRVVPLNGVEVRMEMLTCKAADTIWALAFFDVAEPARISGMLDEWRTTAVANVQGRDPRLAPARIDGMTPNEQAVRLTVSGRLPDGTSVQEHAVFFVHGLRVYRATAIGVDPSAPAVETFFGGLKFPQ